MHWRFAEARADAECARLLAMSDEEFIAKAETQKIDLEAGSTQVLRCLDRAVAILEKRRVHEVRDAASDSADVSAAAGEERR